MIREDKVYVVRFNHFHRIMHVIVMISFLGLALTGLPLRYSESSWAHYLVNFIGGFESAGYLHRFFALVTFGYLIVHLVYLFVFFKFKTSHPFLSFIAGPESMVPGLKDLKDFANNVKWFVGFGPKPQFERWTYWEKFDYWAVFWGVAMIGVSGLFLWFPTFFVYFFPGWVLNVATIVHSDEALLATGFIFIFHFIHAHLRGDKFPIDSVIFTGRVSEEEFKKERPGEFERLKKEGRLHEIFAKPPALWFEVISSIIGFIVLAVGILLITLVIGTFF